MTLAISNERALAAEPPGWLPAPGEASRPGLLFVKGVRRRNFAGHPFWVSASTEACDAIIDRAREHAVAVGLATAWRLADLTPVFRGVLRERGLLPEFPAQFEGKRGHKRIFLGGSLRMHALSGEAEHWIREEIAPEPSGLALSEDDETPFSRSKAYGFLTSDPGFAGPGIAFEAGLHLPALVATGTLPQAQRAMGAMGLELRALDRRAAGAATGYLRLLARGGLGFSAEELRARFLEKIDGLLRAEADALERWRARDPGAFDDAAHRAAGLLRSARRVEYDELLGWISRALAGRRAGALTDVSEAALETLRVRAQPFHVAAENPEAEAGDAAPARAALARDLLSR